jgi:hypothetical protein
MLSAIKDPFSFFLCVFTDTNTQHTKPASHGFIIDHAITPPDSICSKLWIKPLLDVSLNYKTCVMPRFIVTVAY